MFLQLLKAWIKAAKEYTQHNIQSTEEWLVKIFHSSSFFDFIVEEIHDEKVIKKITVPLLTAHNEKERIKATKNFAKAKIMIIKCNDKTLICFGIIKNFAFMLDFQMFHKLYYPKIAKNIYELFIPSQDNVNSIRKRPGMYIGSPNISGLYNMVFGLIEELIDMCEQKTITINISDDCFVKISSESELIFSQNMFSYLSIASTLCESFEWKEKNLSLTSIRGNITHLENNSCINQGFQLHFMLDSDIFSLIKIDYRTLLYRLKEIALLDSNVKIILIDKENKNILEFKDSINTLLTEGSEEWQYSNKKPLHIHFKDRNMEADISFMQTTFKSTIQKSYVNYFRTYGGGTHVKGLINGVKSALNKYHHNKTLKRNADIHKHLNYVIHIKIDDPRFCGSVKRKLANAEVKKIVQENVSSLLLQILEKNNGYDFFIHFFGR